MTENKLRIGFMGTPDFACEALKAIYASGHNVVCVYSQPPRPKGRGHKLAPSPVHAYAQERGIPVFHPETLKSKDVQTQFAAHNLDIAVVAAYGLILPKAILHTPRYGCINIHASLLPRWRGASPIQRAIWEGDAQSGVTLMQMDEGLDTGPEIMKRAIDIAPRESAQTLHDRLATLGAAMTLETLDKLANNGQLSAKEQENDGVTYAHLLRKDDGKINWQEGADKIDRQIRALNPWPGVWTNAGQQRLKIIEALSLNSENAPEEKNQPVGIIINKQGHVQCGGGMVLQLQRVQPAGKQAMDFASALNGGYVKIGQIFS
ncbi:MAG: methionyl-tRNA formyltransferase [Alphaproteobacteria bacterium]